MPLLLGGVSECSAVELGEDQPSMNSDLAFRVQDSNEGGAIVMFHPTSERLTNVCLADRDHEV